MGHQFYYFMAREDFLELERRLRAIQPLVILHFRSQGPAPRVVESSDLVENGERWVSFFLARPEDTKDVVVKHVPQQGYWALDFLQSPVIEYGRCGCDGKQLYRTRMYYVDGYWGPDSMWHVQPEGFQKWAKSVFSTTKRMLKKRGSDYIGPHAQKWVDAGGTLIDEFGHPVR